ncbi:MAG: hypothetical protein RL026_775 [Pseudomonadota bacterium]|jgi:16S rRNA (cytosine967-C5)-methyltransferase
MSAPGSAVLAQAAKALVLVVQEGRTAEDALARLAPTAPERGAVRAILAGTLRHYLALAPLVDALLADPARRPPPAVHALLVAAAHQLRHSRAVPASVVNIAVDAVRQLGQPRASGFVNALLRRLLREGDALHAQLAAQRPAVATAHPPWLLRQWREAWGEAAVAALVAAGNEAPPMVLRLDLGRVQRADYLARLAAAGLPAVAGWLPTTVMLERALPVDQLPGFADGEVSVQDAGAQCAAWMLDAQPGDLVLDACAAPGGKTGHLLEHTPGIELVALDSAAERMARVESNLQRLRRTARCVVADLLEPPDWWDGRPFDRILLDVPCSGTGVIRRHPDIKLLRRPADIAGFAAVQARLLAAATRLLRPGGRLVYVTCSTLPAENAALVAQVLAEPGAALRRTAARLPVAPPGQAAWNGEGGELQLLAQPASGDLRAAHDGFYYACLTMQREVAHA